ncbi:Uncharacterised protein [Salmonella enterica subsp. enterica]|nr:Uncharacterised protein [Salmonella enterica subsp. enterica]
MFCTRVAGQSPAAPARSTFAVDDRLPAIHTSASPALTMAAANISGFAKLFHCVRRRFFSGTGKPALRKTLAHTQVAVWVDDLNAIHRHTMTQGKLTQRKTDWRPERGEPDRTVAGNAPAFSTRSSSASGKTTLAGARTASSRARSMIHGFSPNRC